MNTLTTRQILDVKAELADRFGRDLGWSAERFESVMGRAFEVLADPGYKPLPPHQLLRTLRRCGVADNVSREIHTAIAQEIDDQADLITDQMTAA